MLPTATLPHRGQRRDARPRWRDPNRGIALRLHAGLRRRHPELRHGRLGPDPRHHRRPRPSAARSARAGGASASSLREAGCRSWPARTPTPAAPASTAASSSSPTPPPCPASPPAAPPPSRSPPAAPSPLKGARPPASSPCPPAGPSITRGQRPTSPRAQLRHPGGEYGKRLLRREHGQFQQRPTRLHEARQRHPHPQRGEHL